VIPRRGATWLLIVVAVAGGIVGGGLLPRRIVADASTYVAMATSLVADGDLRYEPRDLDRVRALDAELTPPSVPLPAGLFLVRHDGEYRYAKPLVYPLLAAPFVALLGLRGFYVLNVLAFVTTVVLGGFILVDRLGRGRAIVASAVAVTLSAVPVYVLWIDPLVVLTALVAAGVAAYRWNHPGLAGAALGAVVATRFTYAALLAAPVVVLLAANRRRDAATFGVVACLMVVGSLVLTRWLVGEWSPYIGDRSWYPSVQAVPWGPSGDAGAPVTMGKAALVSNWTPPGLRALGREMMLHLVGRTSGLVLYFPAFAACALWARRLDTEKIAWCAAVAMVLLSFTLVVPHNPNGGTHCLGNRFFVMLPIGLLLVDRGPGGGWRLPATALLLVPALPLLARPVEYTMQPGRVGLAWPHRAFPFEWTRATAVSYPHRFPPTCTALPGCALLALTESQSSWVEPGGVWTVAGSRADFVLIRPADVRPAVRLSASPGATVTDGGVAVPWPDAGSRDVTITLSHPRAVYPDEQSGFTDLAVYGLTIVTPNGAEHDGVFVQPLS
jgi:hypothetical protein